jgi:hypothetical protein
MSTEIDESVLDLPKVELKRSRAKKSKAEKVIKEKKRSDTHHLKTWRDCCFKHAGHKGVLRRFIKNKETGESSEGPDYPIYMKAKEEYNELMKQHKEKQQHKEEEPKMEVEEIKEEKKDHTPLVAEEKKIVVEEKKEKKHKK